MFPIENVNCLWALIIHSTTIRGRNNWAKQSFEWRQIILNEGNKSFRYTTFYILCLNFVWMKIRIRAITLIQHRWQGCKLLLLMIFCLFVTINEFCILVHTGIVAVEICNDDDGGGFFLITQVACLSSSIYLTVFQLFIIRIIYRLDGLSIINGLLVFLLGWLNDRVSSWVDLMDFILSDLSLLYKDNVVLELWFSNGDWSCVLDALHARCREYVKVSIYSRFWSTILCVFENQIWCLLDNQNIDLLW